MKLLWRLRERCAKATKAQESILPKEEKVSGVGMVVVVEGSGCERCERGMEW